MAANDYYNNHPAQPYDEAPYYQNNGFQSHNPRPQHSGQSPASPYEAPFEESSYPLGGMNTHGLDSQTTLGQDSRYYGQGGSRTSFRDDIPLREHPVVPAKDDPTDHVYDAPPNMMAEGGRPPRRSRNRLFKTPLAKIPWVVYILTLIQISVFIAEIAKNGA